jgi:predicted nucleotidyltransferase
MEMENNFQLEKDVKTLFRSVDQCTEKVDKINDKLEKVDDDVRELLNLIKGHPMNRHDFGFIGLVLDNKKKIEKLERFKDRIIWIVVGMSTASGYGISSFVSWLTHKH